MDGQPSPRREGNPFVCFPQWADRGCSTADSGIATSCKKAIMTDVDRMAPEDINMDVDGKVLPGLAKGPLTQPGDTVDVGGGLLLDYGAGGC